jgi:aquaporin Z
MKNYLTEFIGTFFLVLTIGFTVLSGSELAPLAIGSVLMIMVYMGGPISGAHYNPAVTLAIVMRGKMGMAEAMRYWVAQLLGAFAASVVVYIVLGRTFGPAPGVGANGFQALLVEFLYTFALALVVLNVATSRKTAGNSYFGLAIGFTITVGAFAGGPISGGAFNPAVGTGPILLKAMAGHGSLANLWIYLIGPLAGGALAASVYNFQHRGEAD